MQSPGFIKIMKVFFDPEFYRQYKKLNVRIQHKIDQRLRIFRKNPMDPKLNNHLLHEPYQDYRSIDITVDYRAHYKELNMREEVIAYFVLLGTHAELYKKPLTD